MPAQGLGYAMTAILNLLAVILLVCYFYETRKPNEYTFLVANTIILVVALACPWLCQMVSWSFGITTTSVSGAGHLAIAWVIYGLAIGLLGLTVYAFRCTYRRPAPPAHGQIGEHCP